MKHVTITVLLMAFCLIGTALIIGCGEETEDPVTLEGTSGTLGVLKTLDTAPGAPQLIPEGTPTVKSVGYYSDWQLTKKLTGSVSPGKTIFIKVEFSEGMKLVVADDKNARPILYYRMGKELTRFCIAGFGAKGEDFVSGDAKPVKTQATFICKYTVQPEDAGEFVAAVGKLSIDQEGNTLPAFYTHKEKLQLGITNPSIKSVDYYSDWQLTKSLSGTVRSGTTIYTKITFSEEMKQVVSDGNSARPILYYRIGDRDVQHNIVPFSSQGRHYTSGDTKPIKTQFTYVGKYRIKASDHGTFTLVVGKNSANKKGVDLTEEYVHTKSLQIPAPLAPVVTITGAPTGIDNSDTIIANVRGKGATHYKYSVNAGEKCGEYGQPIPIHRNLAINVSAMPDGTVTLCVLGRNSAGVWQSKPTMVQWTRDSSAVSDVPVKNEEPINPEQPEDTMSPTVLSIKYYTDILRTREFGADNGFVLDRADVYTVVRFSEPVTPVITYTTGTGLYQRYTLSQQRLSGHLWEECVPMDTNGTSFMCRSRPVGDVFSVTVTAETTDLDGNRLAEAVTAPTLEITHVEVLGTDLVGRYTLANIPDEARSLLSILNIHPDTLIEVHGEPAPDGWKGGRYYEGPRIAAVYHANNKLRETTLGTLAHELFHAHQHTVAGSAPAWEQTPEGIAYIEAERKDFAEVGRMLGYDKTGPSYESAASSFGLYWSLHHVENSEFLEAIKVDIPNRYRWAEQWFGR